ncbi:ADP-ribosylglycohydrolase family protein [Kribbella sp. NBC_01245]|uniref:ADP-ribosylglycohydrolase family protein n=1 Tax=Kribbella sp. NBC_01245 TaxID=2903578 RepID=UPI002E2A2599|nr:ADP-ribosylglycohydrolase family protein [Kribbella sp. NBC_01245]
MSTDRAAGALYGLAIGDALGMPTQSLPRALIVERYGEVLDGFHPAPPDQPLAAGLPAGAITDDTEQAVLLAELLVASGGRIDGTELAQRLLAWENSMRERGSLDLLGPSTKRAITELLAGTDITETGRFGTTNGAAMRIAPVGIATSYADLPRLVDRVVEASAATHNTGLALAGASAVAAAVSAGVEGATVPEAIAAGIEAARLGAERGRWVAGADVATRIAWATSAFAATSDLTSSAGATASDQTGGLPLGRPSPEGVSLNTTPADGVSLDARPSTGTAPGRPPCPGAVSAFVYDLVGTSLATQESVPAAFAILAAYPDDPWLVCRLAASVGGDCDTIGAMAGAISGACHGAEAFPSEARKTVAEVNNLRLDDLARELLALRYS